MQDSNSAMKILVVEDESRVSDFLNQALEESGYSVTVAQNGTVGLNRLMSGDYVVVILDLMLPDIDGFEVLRKARAAGNKTPVLMLTARNRTEDKVQGLDVGADDYLVKPFELEELLARVRALIRRPAAQDLTLQVDNLILDPITRTAKRGNKLITLSGREFALLEYLMRNHGRVLSKSLLLERVWDDQNVRDSNVVEVYVNYVRNKVEAPGSPKLIHTLRGMGYVMEIRDENPEQP